MRLFLPNVVLLVMALYGIWVQLAPAQSPDMLRVIGSDGEARSITTPEEWARRRREIVQGMELAMGALPDRSPERLAPLEVDYIHREAREFHVRFTISYVAEPGSRVHAFLYVPRGEPVTAGEAEADISQRPGVLALHPTHAIGKGVVDGLSERPNRAYARELADRGFVVIAPDYPSFGDAADYDFSTDRNVSGTMKGIWNHMRAIDVLVARPEVDSEKIAAIGHSLGGHNAMFVGVFDSRIDVIVSSCGWNAFHYYYEGDLKGWSSDRYMPRLRDNYNLDPDQVPFDFYGVVAALAPRPFFSCSPLHDANFAVEGVREVIEAVGPVYKLWNAEEHLQVRYPDAEHDFPPEVRKESYRFIERHLGFEPMMVEKIEGQQ